MNYVCINCKDLNAKYFLEGCEKGSFLIENFQILHNSNILYNSYLLSECNQQKLYAYLRRTSQQGSFRTKYLFCTTT